MTGISSAAHWPPAPLLPPGERRPSSNKDPGGPHRCASGSAAAHYRAHSGTWSRSPQPGPGITLCLLQTLKAGGTRPPCPAWMIPGLRPPLLGPLGCKSLAESLRLLPPQTGNGGDVRVSSPHKGPSSSIGPAIRGLSRRSPLAFFLSLFLERLDFLVGSFSFPPYNLPLTLPSYFGTPHSTLSLV